MPHRNRDCPPVSWSTNTTRLIDWLDEHKEEREVLFGKGAVRGKTKACGTLTISGCGTRAAVAILTHTEDRHLREAVKAQPDHYGRLKKKYQVFNTEIGSAAARTAYKDITVGGALHQKIELLMEKQFPEWSRLHVYWRTIPFFNQYWRPASSASKSASTKFSEKEFHKVMAVNDESESSTESDSESDEAPMVKVSKEAATSSTSTGTVKENKKHLNKQPGPKSKESSVHQRHELRMAEIQLRRQELEFQEKKMTAEIEKARLEAQSRREREKHEIVLQLMALVNASKDNS